MENKDLKAYYLEDEVDLDHLEKDDVIEQLLNLYVEKVYLLAYSYVKDRGIAEYYAG
jgi:hypothetical protein